MVAHYKQGLIISNGKYLSIYVGKSLSKVELDFQGDYVGDNISTLKSHLLRNGCCLLGARGRLCWLELLSALFTFESMPIKSYIYGKVFYKVNV